MNPSRPDWDTDKHIPSFRLPSHRRWLLTVASGAANRTCAQRGCCHAADSLCALGGLHVARGGAGWFRDVRPEHRPRQERHRERPSSSRRQLRLYRGDEPRRLCELRAATGERGPHQQELCRRRQEMRVSLDLRQAQRRHLLFHDDNRHEVQDQEGRGTLHGEAGDGGKLYELL